MDKKLLYLSTEKNISEDELIFILLGEANAILPGNTFSAYYTQVCDDKLICYKIKSKGLFKKEYHIENSFEVPYSLFTKAEFGVGNGNLWLQTMTTKGPFTFTSGNTWFNPAGKKFVQILDQQIGILDIAVYNKKMK